MDVKDLEQKVANADAKVQKCKDTIGRHEKQLEKKVLAAEKLGCAVRGLNHLELDEYVRLHRDTLSHEQIWAVIDIQTKFDDIKGAKSKLKDAEQVLQTWESKLRKAVQEEQLIEANCPPVIREFLEQWKANCTEYYQNKFRKWPEFTQALSDAETDARIECLRGVAEVGAEQFVADNDLETYLWPRTSLFKPPVGEDEKASKYQKMTESYKERWELYLQRESSSLLDNVYPRSLMDAYLKSQKLDWQSINERRKNFGGELLLKMVEQGGEAPAFAYLEKALEAEKKAKILDLITRIEKITGKIIDGDDLHIGYKGDLEGIITGENGKAKINTIGAGGYNIQCFHFRTLIHEFKEKDIDSVIADAVAKASNSSAFAGDKGKMQARDK